MRNLREQILYTATAAVCLLLLTAAAGCGGDAAGGADMADPVACAPATMERCAVPTAAGELCCAAPSDSSRVCFRCVGSVNRPGDAFPGCHPQGYQAYCVNDCGDCGAGCAPLGTVGDPNTDVGCSTP